MKTFLMSAGLALGLGLVALAPAPAEAAPISTRSVIVAPAATGDVACRVVKRTTYRNGVRRVVTTRECDRMGRRDRGFRDDRRRYDRSDRRYDRRYDDRRPGLSIRVN